MTDAERIPGLVLDAEGRVVAGGVVLRDGVVAGLLPTDAATGGAVIFPGFVDVHCHGGGGASFPDDLDAESIARAARVHANAGTTALIGSLVSLIDPFPAIAALADACDAGVLAGINLEGPYVSLEQCGAQNPAAIRPIDLDELGRMLEAGRGWIRSMTLAPELDGALDAAEALLRAGARPSWGHTSASAERTLEVLAATATLGRRLGVDRPAQTVTHLFNAMPPLHHRAPGPVLEFLAAARRGDAVVEVIGDGAHLDTALVVELIESLDAAAGGKLGSCVLVTDAMAAAGMPDGDYSLGALRVSMREGRAYLEGTTTLAGGTSTLAEQARALLAAGVHPSLLARAACGNPARALGLPLPEAPAVGQPFRGVVIA